MGKFTKRLLAFAVIGGLVFTPINAGAWDEKGDKKGKHSERMEKWSEELGLSAEQKEELKESKDSSKVEKEAILTNLKIAREALNEELKKPEIDQAAVDNAVTDIKKAQGDLVDYRVESFLSMKGILTQEQFQKMSEMKGKREGKRDKKKHRKDETEESTTPDA